ncbi:MAG: type II secretion system protein [Verrucomicrobia bacterium]|nr:type II secretion system protein [Verrucomicrobiota bacterium]
MPTKPVFRLGASSSSGTTLAELSIVITVLLLLASMVVIGTTPYIAYRDGRQAGEALRSVYAAQMNYLSDNPGVDLTSLTPATATADIVPYLPNGTSLPVLPSVNGVTPQILVNRIPPVASLDGKTPYDPSGSTTDGLWDIGSY